MKEKKKLIVLCDTHICFGYIAKFHIAYFKDKIFVDIKKNTHHIGVNKNEKKPRSIQVHYQILI